MYEEECDIVTLLHTRVRPATVPAEILARILQAIGSEEQAGFSPRRSLREMFRQSVIIKPAIAFVLSFAALVFFLSRPGSVIPPATMSDAGGSELVMQSEANYQAVLRGEMLPQVLSDIPGRVRTFFEGKTEFPVMVPVMRECTLVGGTLNEYHGAPLAHLVYKHGDQTIYLYQACRATVMKGERIHLCPEATREIERTGWYCGTTPRGDGIVVWTKGKTICAAVAPMTGEHLMAQLADADHVGAW